MIGSQQLSTMLCLLTSGLFCVEVILVSQHLINTNLYDLNSFFEPRLKILRSYSLWNRGAVGVNY